MLHPPPGFKPLLFIHSVKSSLSCEIFQYKIIFLTISWATTSGISFTKSKVNSMAPVSLYFPFSFLASSTHSFRAIDDFFPSSSSLSSTLTPVSSAKNAWFRRSLMEYLQENTQTADTDPHYKSLRQQHLMWHNTEKHKLCRSQTLQAQNMTVKWGTTSTYINQKKKASRA